MQNQQKNFYHAWNILPFSKYSHQNKKLFTISIISLPVKVGFAMGLFEPVPAIACPASGVNAKE
ncbi:MAG: hypothetical protein M3Z56_06410 [Bacteroidota bacterium]|nr:hypothetical protein [Bacteroidota bacterium]